MTAFQHEALTELIGERLRGTITTEHFQKIMELEKSRGGIGIRQTTGFGIVDRFESILRDVVMKNNMSVSGTGTDTANPEMAILKP